ncbi:MAG: UvrD-helicase domain-containing protein, partial [Proteobacteria bacterium]|nr:UvrD-helicase domain-containing protein [Pseudomonadota bacterium]
SGKTYRLTEELEKALAGGVNPAHVIGTTFTVKAAAELEQKVRERLIGSGRMQLAEQMAQARLGTVHSVCERLLKDFSFELGLSPRLNVMSLADGQHLFNQALDEVLTLGKVIEMNGLAARLKVSAWQAEVKTVSDKIRENDIDLAAVAGMGVESANSLLKHFPPATREVDTQKLISAIQAALEGVDQIQDPTKVTDGYLQRLRQCIYQLRREDCPWSVWVTLAVAAPGKKSDRFATVIRAAASGYECSRAYQADLRTFIEAVFDLAGSALQRFAQIKAERGLIDFLDMEQLMLKALDQPDVRDRLADELDLLLVDEFQDTNPMQLALFVNLATLARRVIFVGDVKQAVYAFRGCDPELVFATLAGMTAANADQDVLPNNYRSRPPLVSYVNEVFSAIFAGAIERAQVELKAVRTDQTGEPAVLHWQLEGKVRTEQVGALCAGIAHLKESGFKVTDPVSEEVRPIEWRDIAVLAYTNAHVEEIASVLQDKRIPMKMTLKGLLATPEVVFARACLRRLNDVTDTLATAEIISMSSGADPESWLADRLAYLQAGDSSFRWAENSNPVISRLAELRIDSAFRSPVEVVARVTNDVFTRRIITGWGPDSVKAAQRQRNLDAFLNLAVEYENHCGAHFEAASTTGFLFWLENPSSPDLDLQPELTGGDAVHVLTYHKSKGLEWPVVIATDFDHTRKQDLWGVRVEQTVLFSIDAPLANRVVRYWPDPFGGRSSGIDLLNDLLQTADAQQISDGAKFEAQRLAYVGLTRAREANVFALKASGPGSGWLADIDPGFVLPTGESHLLPGGELICTRVNKQTNGETQAQGAFKPIWFKTRPRKTYASAFVYPSDAAPIKDARPGLVTELGDRIVITSGSDITPLGSALHAIIAAEAVNPDQADAVSAAQMILDAWGVGGAVSAEDAVLAAKRFVHALGQGERVVEYPLMHVLEDGRVVRGWLDALVHRNNRWQVIDHKSSPRPRSELAAEVTAYSGQLKMYADVVEAVKDESVEQAIHFPITGLIATIKSPVPGQLDLFGQ